MEIFKKRKKKGSAVVGDPDGEQLGHCNVGTLLEPRLEPTLASS